MNPAQYYLYLDSQTTGPYVLADLFSLRDRGAITDQTLASADGWERWKTIGEIIGTAPPRLPPLPRPPPPPQSEPPVLYPVPIPTASTPRKDKSWVIPLLTGSCALAVLFFWLIWPNLDPRIPNRQAD